MLIKKFRTKYHKYIFQFDYAPFIVEKVKEIQAGQLETWKDLSFYKDEKSPENVGWVFSSFCVFEALCEEFDPIVEEKVNEEMEKIKKEEEETAERVEKIEAINTEKLNDKLKVPTLKELFPFQKKCVDFVEKVGGRALIADEMGLGKTIEAIGYAVHKKYSRVLVIAPASVKENWKREIRKFAGKEARILDKHEITIEKNWLIIGYPSLKPYYDKLKKQKFDLIIVDESHYIKNSGAIRTKKTLALLKKAKDVIFLSGTPILNRPEDIYTVFNFIRPMPFWGNTGFAMRYCGLAQDPYGKWDYSGSSNLDELKEKMRFMIKRSKKEVVEELPDKTITVIETEMKDWKEYNQIITDFKTWLKSRDLNMRAVFAEALTKVNYLKQVVVENKNVSGFIDDLLENDKKVIVFSQYRGVVEELKKRYGVKGVILTGTTPLNERQKAIDSFQNDDDVKLFFSTVKAGGVGITLTEADTVVFTDLDWTPATHHQAEDRAYRIGQKNNVNVYYLITPKTVETEIWKLLKRKETTINKIMAGEKARKAHIKTVLKNL